MITINQTDRKLMEVEQLMKAGVKNTSLAFTWNSEKVTRWAKLAGIERQNKDRKTSHIQVGVASGMVKGKEHEEIDLTREDDGEAAAMHNEQDRAVMAAMERHAIIIPSIEHDD